MRCARPTLLVLGALVIAGCAPEEAPGLPWSEADLIVLRTMTQLQSPSPSLPPPSSLPDELGELSLSPIAEFGWELFFDPGLSVDGSLSCASCHKPELHFTDGQETATGLGKSKFNTPTVVGLGSAPFLMWDGRKDSLWSQAFEPLFGPSEMGNTPEGVAHHVREHHADEYEALFGPAADKTSLEICIDVGLALEAYQERLLLEPAPFDRFLEHLFAGDPRGGGHMTREAVRGLRSFIGDGGCVGCHSGPWLSDFSFHALPLPGSTAGAGRSSGIHALRSDPYRKGGPRGRSSVDPGYDYLDADFIHHRGAYKTPSLRNVALTAPYTHTGELETLDDVIRFYSELPASAAGQHLSPLLHRAPGELPVRELVAFLHTLTSPPQDVPWFQPPPEGADACSSTVHRAERCGDMATPMLPDREARRTERKSRP